MKSSMRSGIVLFITLAILTLLGSIVFLFLHQTGELKKSVRQNAAVIQTNLLLEDLSVFLKRQNFSQDDIFYGAGIPVSLELGTIAGNLTIDSTQRKLNINALLEDVTKNQESLNTFLAWMARKKIKQPYLLLAFLLDTLDTDLFERGRMTEIRKRIPWFQNGSIPNSTAMKRILNDYRLLTRDPHPTLAEWEEVFDYEGKTFDLNYASADQLTLLFPNFPLDLVERLSAHNTRWERLDDIPVEEIYKLDILQPHMGITPILKTESVTVDMAFTTTRECSGKIGFRLELKRKRITHLQLSQIICS